MQMPQSRIWKLLASVSLLLSAGAMTVTLSPSASSPMPVGTMVTFTAAVKDAQSPDLWYRFRVREQGGDYQIIRDYGPVTSLAWTAAGHEGLYEMEVSARDIDSGDGSTTSVVYQFRSLVLDGKAVVSPTSNPLVFLYSAPSCARSSRMLIEFQIAGGTVQKTPLQACSSDSSMNIYLAGLRANSTYTARHVVYTRSTLMKAPGLTFTTGPLPSNLYSDTILIPAGRSSSSDPILLGSPLGANPVAHDLSGNVVWYGPGGAILTRVETGGEFWGFVEATGQPASQQVIRKFDLAGMTLLETNAARVSEQLKAMGRRTVTGFHHEVRTISGERIAALAGVEQILTGVQGAGPVDVLGDMIVILDKDLNVVWTWDSFDNLDVHRAAVLRETCPTAGCPQYYLAQTANDWTHGNAVQETADGNLLYSARNQDWLIKIAYDHGNGDGHIIWRLGNDGDFRIQSDDPYPWFSHQHDGNFEIGDSTKLLVFDDGDTRVAKMNGGNSRGQVLQIDEQNRVVIPVLNADLGLYAAAVGSAQQLRNGNYHFNVGFVQENGTVDSYSLELTRDAIPVYKAHQDTILYRTFRLADMYSTN